MSNPMNHAHLQELLPQYAAGTLTERVHQDVAAHLTGCASCQADLDEWHAIIKDVHEELAELPPDNAQEQSWSALRARLTLQPGISDHMTNSTSTTTTSSFDQLVRWPSPTHTRNRAPQRWLGFVSVVAVIFITLASLVLFGALGHAHMTRTTSITSTSIATSATSMTSTTVATNTSGCVNAKPSGHTLPQYTNLLAMSFDSPGDGWATGLQYSTVPRQPFTGVIYHLQNCHWQRFPIALPKIGLDTISMVSADEGWAAGSLTKTGQWAVQDRQALVVFHYQQGHWQQVKVPGTAAYVSGEIVMQSASEGWLVGQGASSVSNGSLRSLPDGLLHYQNGTWSPASLPPNITDGVDFPLVPVGRDDVWFASRMSSSSDGSFTYTSIVHDQGGHVTIYLLPPNTTVSGLAFPAANDGWMVGSGGNPQAQGLGQQPVLMHFEGQNWQYVSVPTTFQGGQGDNNFSRISLVSPEEGFIFGYTLTPANSDAPLLLYHLHHGQWAVYQIPADQALKNAASVDLHMVSANEGWAFALQQTGVPGALRTVILHFTNGTWSVFAN